MVSREIGAELMIHPAFQSMLLRNGTSESYAVQVIPAAGRTGSSQVFRPHIHATPGGSSSGPSVYPLPIVGYRLGRRSIIISDDRTQ